MSFGQRAMPRYPPIWGHVQGYPMGAVGFLFARVTRCSQRMRLSMQLGGFALALAVFSVGLVEASMGEPVEPAPSLAEQFQSLAAMVTTRPRDAEDCYFASQELVDGIGAVVSLVLDNLFEFAHDNSNCQLILQGLIRGFCIANPGSYMFTDYAGRC